MYSHLCFDSPVWLMWLKTKLFPRDEHYPPTVFHQFVLIYFRQHEKKTTKQLPRWRSWHGICWPSLAMTNMQCMYQTRLYNANVCRLCKYIPHLYPLETLSNKNNRLQKKEKKINNKQSLMCLISAFCYFFLFFFPSSVDVLDAFYPRENCLWYKHSLGCLELHVQCKIDFPFSPFTKKIPALLNFSQNNRMIEAIQEHKLFVKLRSTRGVFKRNHLQQHIAVFYNPASS